MSRNTPSKTSSGATILRAWVVAVIAAFFAGSAYPQGVDLSGFQRSTLDALDANLAAVVAAGERQAPAKVGDTISGSALASWVVEVNYAGSVRPMTDAEKAFVSNSFKAVQQDSLAALYAQSMLFRANGKDYWIPVQSDAIPYFAKELKAGEKIDLYVLQAGGLRQKTGWDWLFLVIDFQKPQGGPAKGRP